MARFGEQLPMYAADREESQIAAPRRVLKLDRSARVIQVLFAVFSLSHARSAGVELVVAVKKGGSLVAKCYVTGRGSKE